MAVEQITFPKPHNVLGALNCVLPVFKVVDPPSLLAEPLLDSARPITNRAGNTKYPSNVCLNVRSDVHDLLRGLGRNGYDARALPIAVLVEGVVSRPSRIPNGGGGPVIILLHLSSFWSSQLLVFAVFVATNIRARRHNVIELRLHRVLTPPCAIARTASTRRDKRAALLGHWQRLLLVAGKSRPSLRARNDIR